MGSTTIPIWLEYVPSMSYGINQSTHHHLPAGPGTSPAAAPSAAFAPCSAPCAAAAAAWAWAKWVYKRTLQVPRMKHGYIYPIFLGGLKFKKRSTGETSFTTCWQPLLPLCSSASPNLIQLAGIINSDLTKAGKNHPGCFGWYSYVGVAVQGWWSI